MKHKRKLQKTNSALLFPSILGTAALIAICLFWWLAGSNTQEPSGVTNPATLPPPSQVMAAASARPAALPITLQEFTATTQQTLRSLPNRGQIAQLSEAEVQHTPMLVVQAGRKLGQILEMLDAHPELAQQGARFYTDCALQANGVTTIRALCLANLRELSRKHQMPLPSEVENLPAQVKKLADLANDF